MFLPFWFFCTSSLPRRIRATITCKYIDNWVGLSHSSLSKRAAAWGEDGRVFNYGIFLGHSCACWDFFAHARAIHSILPQGKNLSARNCAPKWSHNWRALILAPVCHSFRRCAMNPVVSRGLVSQNDVINIRKYWKKANTWWWWWWWSSEDSGTGY